jgi:hypothetical protein
VRGKNLREITIREKLKNESLLPKSSDHSWFGQMFAQKEDSWSELESEADLSCISINKELASP